MKLIIDIPDKDYEFIKDIQTLVIGSRGNCKTLQYNVITAIKNGVPYEERPKGEWIMNKTSKRGRNYTCTNCEKISRNKFSFCPNCGAEMEEAEND